MQETADYSRLIREKIGADYRGMFRPARGGLKYPFIVPGSASYANCLWDWDSWLSNIALAQLLADQDDEAARADALAYERGCILNFLAFTDHTGWMPIIIDSETPEYSRRPDDPQLGNFHKPVLAQHAAFLVRRDGGDAEWLRDGFEKLQFFHNLYRNHFRHPETGLYLWADDYAIGVDNDPCTFGRPRFSSASILLNCFMFKEFEAAAYLADRLFLDEIGECYRRDAADLKKAIRDHCYDEWTGFYYSCDVNLLPRHRHEKNWPLHSGQPRDWDCLIMRIGVWSGFLAMWAGIASPEEAERMVVEHYRNERTFNAPFGVRTLSKLEKMYNLRASGNPSSWLGPVWGISNYFVFRGLVRYGYRDDARSLAEKTVRLFGRDFERFGALHEYYQPENGEPLLNRGFQNWNYLVLNMISWLERGDAVAEF